MALTSSFQAAVVLCPLYIILVTIYRLTLHPLAKYPGPTLWKISGWPDGLATKSGRRHLIHYQLHCKYGHIVRIGPNKLSYDTAQAFHDIHTNRNANVIKSGFVGFTRAVADSLHLQQIVDKREHAQRRKIMAHAFSDSALKSAEAFMLKQIRNWTTAMGRGADKTADGWSETKDLGHWTNLLTLDVFGELCFGQDFGATNAGDHHIIHFIINGIKMSQILACLPIAPLTIPILRTQVLLKLLSRKAYAARWDLRHYLESLVSKRQEAELESQQKQTAIRNDFFHYVLQACDDDGNMLPLKGYVAEAVLLIAAGTDTTSTALSAALHYLTSNPSKLATLRAEIDGAFTSVEDIHTGPTLSSLTYLRSCIDESMRMTPPVPGTLSRHTLPGGTTVSDTHFPAGIDLEVPMYALTHNSSFFPDPFSFLPERWIAGSKTPTFEVTEQVLAEQRHAFQPFSSGARNCLGMRMAYMEMGIVLARLVFLFDMRFDTTKGQKTTGEFETQDWFISTKEGPHLQFRPRRRAEKA